MRKRKYAYKTVTIVLGPKFYFIFGLVTAFGILLIWALLFSKPVSAIEIIKESTNKFESLKEFQAIYDLYLGGKRVGKDNLIHRFPFTKSEIYILYENESREKISVVYELFNESDNTILVIECEKNEENCIGYPYFITSPIDINYSRLNFRSVKEVVDYLNRLLEAMGEKIKLELKKTVKIVDRDCYLIEFNLPDNSTIDICYDKEVGIPLLFKARVNGEEIFSMEAIFFSKIVPFDISPPSNFTFYPEKPPSFIHISEGRFYNPPQVEKIACTENKILLKIKGSPEKTYYLSYLEQKNISDEFGPNIILHGLPNTIVEQNVEKIIEINFPIEDWRIMDEIVIPNPYPKFEKIHLPHKFMRGHQIMLYFCESPYFDECIEDWGNELFGIPLDKTLYTPKYNGDIEFFTC
ncbi:MAG: hypothetical protein QW228_03020 [Candidatus Aenigmatarchaeota archaeon]